MDYEGGVLDGASRIAIQMAHRLFAVVVAVYLLWLGVRLFRLPSMRGWASALIALLVLQVTLGILNVKLALPLEVAVAQRRGRCPVVRAGQPAGPPRPGLTPCFPITASTGT